MYLFFWFVSCLSLTIHGQLVVRGGGVSLIKPVMSCWITDRFQWKAMLLLNVQQTQSGEADIIRKILITVPGSVNKLVEYWSLCITEVSYVGGVLGPCPHYRCKTICSEDETTRYNSLKSYSWCTLNVASVQCSYGTQTWKSFAHVGEISL